MLDCSDSKRNLAEWILALPCYVSLPPRLRSGFEKTGPAVAVSDDERNVYRMYCRGERYRAALGYAPTFPALPRPPAWHGVYTNDVSRHGCSFFHSEPLYPGERLRLVLLTGVEVTIEVAWCRRQGERCFSAGARFLETAAASAPQG